MKPIAELKTDGNLGPDSSLVAAYGICGVPFLAFVVLLAVHYVRHRLAAAAADRSLHREAPLVEGPVIIAGTVEHAASGDVAVRVEVSQEATEYEDSGQGFHIWTERERRVNVAPFYLRHESGKRIRIEPPEDVLLVDEMDGKILVSKAERILTAELIPGEALFARGELVMAHDPDDAAGYRDSAKRLVLRAPRGERMLLSSQPLGERFARRARLHRRWLLVVLTVALLCNAILIPFHARLWLGELVIAEVVELKHRIVEDSDGDRHLYELTSALPDGKVVRELIDRHEWTGLQPGDRIHYRRVPGWEDNLEIGSRPTTSVILFLFPLIAFVCFVSGYVAHRRSSRPWFEQSAKEKVSGPLPEAPTPKDSGAGNSGERDDGAPSA